MSKKSTSLKKKTNVLMHAENIEQPEEFEEFRSLNNRMKPQPFKLKKIKHEKEKQ